MHALNEWIHKGSLLVFNIVQGKRKSVDLVNTRIKTQRSQCLPFHQDQFEYIDNCNSSTHTANGLDAPRVLEGPHQNNLHQAVSSNRCENEHAQFHTAFNLLQAQIADFTHDSGLHAYAATACLSTSARPVLQVNSRSDVEIYIEAASIRVTREVGVSGFKVSTSSALAIFVNHREVLTKP